MNIYSRSTFNSKSDFDQDFSNLPEKCRERDFRTGLLPAQVWNQFLNLNFPAPLEFWIVKDGDTVVGRVGANVSLLKKTSGAIGFFEVDTNHPQASAAAALLLSTAQKWLISLGVTEAIGPMNLNTWFAYRFRVKPKDPMSFQWEPVNPPEFPKYFESAGFSAIENYKTHGLQGIDAYIQKTKPTYDTALSKGFSFRPFDGNHLLDREVPHLYTISMIGFKNNFLFEPIDGTSFKQLYVPIANKLDVSFSFFALNPEGKEVGYLFAFVDQGYIVFKSSTVLPEARGLGLSNALMYLSAEKAKAAGVSKMITALVKSGNQSESYAKKAEVLWEHKYILYRKDLKP